MGNIVFPFNFSKNQEMEKLSNNLLSVSLWQDLCLPHREIVPDPVHNCRAICSALWGMRDREEARSMTAEQLKYHVLYFPSWAQSRFSLRSKKPVVEILYLCIDRKLIPYLQAVYSTYTEANPSCLKAEMLNPFKIPHLLFKRPPYPIIFKWT